MEIMPSCSWRAKKKKKQRDVEKGERNEGERKEGRMLDRLQEQEMFRRQKWNKRRRRKRKRGGRGRRSKLLVKKGCVRVFYGKSGREVWEGKVNKINKLTPVLTSDSMMRSFRANVSPCFILMRFLSRHFIAYIFPVSALRHPYTSPKPPRPMIRWTLKSFIVNCRRRHRRNKQPI